MGVKHVSLAGMETVTIRELRQNWPAVEKRLAAAGGLTVTRDSHPVAVLTPARPAAVKRKAPKRFEPGAHRQRLEKIWGPNPPAFSFSAALARDRAERKL
jgi:antitoxin (DNA-binding transcriptional repressor) of toxin-antitoxin stability system